MVQHARVASVVRGVFTFARQMDREQAISIPEAANEYANRIAPLRDPMPR